MQNSTSLQWIYTRLREDYDIQTKGIHLFNIIDLNYNDSTMTPTGFYNQYRMIIMNNLAKTGDVIRYKSATLLTANEIMGPTFKDIILLQVINLIDTRLPQHIRNVYSHKIDQNLRLMDFKSDILVNIPKFRREIEEREQLSAMRTDTHLSALKTWRGGRGTWNNTAARSRGGRGARRGGRVKPPGWSSIHCSDCYHHNQGKNVYNSHNQGDPSCPTGPKYGTIDTNTVEAHEWDRQENNFEQNDQSFAEVWDLQDKAYHPDDPTINLNFDEVGTQPNKIHNSIITDQPPYLNYIAPVLTQILTV